MMVMEGGDGSETGSCHELQAGRPRDVDKPGLCLPRQDNLKRRMQDILACLGARGPEVTFSFKLANLSCSLGSW